MVLLDINVLIALLDGWHPHHSAALRFLKQALRDGWATCPLTENGFLRIFGHANYQHGPGSVAEAARLLREYCGAPGHQFWADDATLLNASIFPNLPGAKHLTDLYLLGLAVKHEGKLATFDRRIDPSLVIGGAQALTLLPHA